jgi:hypothetical protein
VHVARGAVALVINMMGTVSVLALHTGSGRSISVGVGFDEVTLGVGQELVLSTPDSPAATPAATQVNVRAGIAVRGTVQRVLAGGVRAYTCDFSIPAALSNLKALSGLAQSADKRSRACYRKILKDAAILQTITAHKGVYKACLL